jgi:hypothetical protein
MTFRSGMTHISLLGSARASRAGAGALASANFFTSDLLKVIGEDAHFPEIELVAARRRNRHARRVRSPEARRRCNEHFSRLAATLP